MKGHIRPLEARDLPELEQLCREHAQYEKSPWNEGERSSGFAENLLDAPGAWCWVVEEEQELAGYASATLEFSTWDAAHYLHLDCLYLRAAYRGNGLGRALVEQAARVALEHGAINLQWQTPQWNEGAERFYRRMGASATGKLRFTLEPEQCRSLLQNSTPPSVPLTHAPEESAQMSELHAGLVHAATILSRFYGELDQRRVSPSTPLTEIVADFEGSLGEEGVGMPRALQDVEELVLPNAMTIPHPLYLGLINSSPLAGGIVADALVSGMNNNAGSWQQSPPFSAAEQEVLRCFKSLLGLAPEATGLVLPGGSYATLHALQLARDSVLPEWRTKGARALAGDPRVYVSEAAHFSAVRAAQALGVAKQDVVLVPSLGRGQIDAQALGQALREDRERGALPFAVVATLGTTGTGAMDSLPEIVELCREHGLWLHVDACYGGAGALLEELSESFEGLADADSVAVDPHKWFFVPMVAGLLFTRHPGLELSVFDIDAPYIPTEELVDGFRRALPTSRRCAGFAVWLALRAHGLETVRAAVRRNVELARHFESRLRDSGFRVLAGGALSIACARWEPKGLGAEELNALQLEITAAVVATGSSWFGTVRVQDSLWLRFALVNIFTRQDQIDALADQIAQVARALPETR